MTELENKLKRIQDKLQLLLKQFASLQSENNRLKKELEKNTKNSFVYQQNIDDLKQQVAVLKITSGNWEETDKKDFNPVTSVSYYNGCRNKLFWHNCDLYPDSYRVIKKNYFTNYTLSKAIHRSISLM